MAELEPEKPEVKAAAPEPAKPQASSAVQSLGLGLAELTAAEKKELNLKGGVRIASAEGPGGTRRLARG